MSKTNKNRKYGSRKDAMDYKTRDRDGRFASDENSIARTRNKQSSQRRTDTCNDVNWYVKDSTELGLVAGLSYAHASGLPVRAGLREFTVSGICTLSLVPGVGISVDEHSALNLAARDLYSFVRHKNSGSANYDAPDLMMYILAMDSIYSIYVHVVRAFGLLDYYSSYNRYLPKTLLASLGFDFDDLVQNRPLYEAWLSNFQKRLDVFHVPKTMPLFERHAFAFGSIYADSDNAKTQLYAYKPETFFVLDEFIEGKPGQLTCHKLNEAFGGGEAAYPFDYWQGVLNRMLDPIVTSEAFQIMNGDILKAYGENVWSVGAYNPTHRTPIVHEPTVLEQMMNAIALPLVSDPELSWDITQDVETNTIRYQPGVQWLQEYNDANVNYAGWTPPGNGYILNSYEVKATPEMVMENTRLMPFLWYNGNGVAGVHECSAELCDHFSIWTFNSYENSWQREGYAYFNVTRHDQADLMDAYKAYRIGRRLAVLEQFDYHPAVYEVIQDNMNGETTPIYHITPPSISLENYTEIETLTLEAQHQMAILRLFGVSG